MNHDAVHFIAQVLLYLLIPCLPIFIYVFTDRFRRQPSPEQYGGVLALAAILGILLFVPTITVIAGTALAALGIARLTANLALFQVTFQRRIQRTRLFPGDEVDLELVVSNRKLLPLAWLSLVQPIRHGLVRPGKGLSDLMRISERGEATPHQGDALAVHTALAHYQSLTRTYHLKAIQRGVLTLEAASIRSGDPFGIFQREAVTGRPLDIVVYPRIYSPDEIDLSFQHAMGDTVIRRALVEDPMLMAGTREYSPGDPMHRVHWKATARSGALQLRMADSSTTACVMLVINLNTFQHIWQGMDFDRMEATIAVGASMALWALERDFAVGLRSNGVVLGLDNTPRIIPSAHPNQSAVLLDQLARLSFSGRISAEQMLMDDGRRLQSGTSIVFVTPTLNPETIALLTGRRLAGRVSVVYCGRFAAPVVRGLPIHLASPPSEPLYEAS
ncbi:MAG: DUF58 domain-containing protein [Chloroflexota bacterium]